MKKPFSNIELVTIAVYLLGGDSKYVDTEDIAVRTNELAPGRFAWRKYPDQINIQNVGKRLSDAKNPDKGGYITGSYIDGWILSEKWIRILQKNGLKDLEGASISRPPLNKKEMA